MDYVELAEKIVDPLPRQSTLHFDTFFPNGVKIMIFLTHLFCFVALIRGPGPIDWTVIDHS